MKNLNLKAVFPVLTVLLMLFVIGCQEQAGNGSKKVRLLEDKNYRLTQKYEQQLKEYDDQLAREKQALDQCVAKQAELEKQAEETMGFLMETVIKDTSDRNAQLEEENKTLKARIEQFGSEIENLKGKLVTE